MESQTKDLETICECCKKLFFQTTILRHIGKSKYCKSFYGPRFIEMKKEKGREKVYKHRHNSVVPARQLKKRRDLYANNPDLKEKNRQIYQKNKEKIKEENEKSRTKFRSFLAKENAEKILREGTTPNILHKSIEKLEDFQKVFEESKIYCDYCKEEFGQNAILKKRFVLKE